MTAKFVILGRRLHLLAGERGREPRPAAVESAPDHLARGEAWARVYLMRDGTVVAEGKSGAAVLNGELAQEAQAFFRGLGIKERR